MGALMIQNYHNPHPRLNVRYVLQDAMSFKNGEGLLRSNDYIGFCENLAFL
jgi:hypothetical protein